MHAITIAAHNVWFVYRCYTYIVCAFKTYIGTQFVLLELGVPKQLNIRLANHSLHSIQWTYHIMNIIFKGHTIVIQYVCTCARVQV